MRLPDLNEGDRVGIYVEGVVTRINSAGVYVQIGSIYNKARFFSKQELFAKPARVDLLQPSIEKGDQVRTYQNELCEVVAVVDDLALLLNSDGAPVAHFMEHLTLVSKGPKS